MVTSLTDMLIMEAICIDTVITAVELRFAMQIIMHRRAAMGKSILAAHHNHWLGVTRPSAQCSRPF